MGISFAKPENLTLIFDAENREQWQRTSYIVECLDLKSDTTVADIGAGTGYFSNLFAQTVKKVYAIDCEPNMVSYMQERFTDSGQDNIEMILSTPSNPCLPVGVDLVFVANAYRFITDRPRFLHHLYQQISAHCKLFFVDFKGDNARVSVQMAKAEVEAAGFSIVSMDINSCPDHYLMALVKP